MLLIISILIVLSGAAAQAADTVEQHRYVPGELFHYVFEDTESTFSAKSNGSVLEPERMVDYQELVIPFTIRIEKNRVLRFAQATYRSAEPDKFNSVKPEPLTHVITKFPAHFSYSYKSDGQAIREVIAAAYAPFRASDIGTFVYYKAMDIHTFQSVIDALPSTLSLGQILRKPGMEIPLPDGIFHNGPATIHYAGNQKIDSRRCAYFKVVTMGNDYHLARNGEDIFTNYQYSFYVPLEGRYQGLLYRGDLQETVVKPPSYLLQRQLSMRLIDK